MVNKQSSRFGVKGKRTERAIAELPEVIAWRKVELARHPQRPRTLDYIAAFCADFVELHGDRLYGDDPALVGGLASFNGETIVILGHQKGRDSRENVERHFGMPRPEGYRKALRLMRLAEKFGFPVVTLIDTPGADPTLPSEERGQAWAIAANLFAMAQLRVPIVAVVTGEGGSGGALAIGVGDRVLMMENAIYSVVSPEGCASILWRDSSLAPKAAAAMKVTAQDLLDGGIIDAIVPEPPGGAHVDPAAAAASLREALLTQLDELSCRYRLGTGWCVDELLAHRFVRYRRLGVFVE